MYSCKMCLYTTTRLSNLERHYDTKKHIIRAEHESKKNNTCEITNSLSSTNKFSNDNQKNENNMDDSCDLNDDLNNNIHDDLNDNPNDNLNDDPNDNLNDESKNISSVKHHKCERCNKTYSSYKNLWRHKDYTICGVMIKKEKEDKNKEILELKCKVEKMSEKLLLVDEIFKKMSFVENVNNKLTQELEQYKNNIKTNNSINNLDNSITNNLDNSINNHNSIVINYINKSYQNAPALKMLRSDETCELLKM